MSGSKRSLEEDGPENASLHPSRRRRLEHGEDSAQIAIILNDLADNLPTVRQEASRKLLTSLSERPHLLDYTLTRLIKGLCSDRKAARLGFSIALVEVLRLDRTQTKFPSLRSLVDQVLILTRPEGNASGQERRASLLGQRSAYHAILLSDILRQASEDEIRHLFNVMAELSAEKQWLRGECLAVLHEYINQENRDRFTDQNARHLIDSWEAKGLLKTPEGVALWVSVRDAFPQAKLPKGVWDNNNPISAQNRPHLTKIMLKDAAGSDDVDGNVSTKKGGSRQLTPSSAWGIVMNHLYLGEKRKDLASFWSDCVAKSMFSASSSTERKALGLQLFSQALLAAPCESLNDLVHPNIVRCILDQRAKSDRFLFESAKSALDHMAARGKKQPDAATPLVIQMMKIVNGNLDQLIKKTLETLLGELTPDGLNDAVSAIVDLCWRPGVEDAGQAEQKRRVLADMLLTSVRSRRGEPSQLFLEKEQKKGFILAPWLASVLEGLVSLGYGTTERPISPALNESSRLMFRKRLMSCLSDLLDRPLEQAILAPSTVIAALHSARKHLAVGLSAEVSQIIKDARKLEKTVAEKARAGNGPQATADRASQLLIALSMLEAYNQEPESQGVLQDLISYHQTPQEDEDSSSTLVELLLSFVSKESALFRKLAEQVFSAFAPDVTRDGLQSMMDILQQKEGLSGQQELFNQHDDGTAEDASDDEEAVDVEDDSDVELVNGEIVKANGNTDDDEDSESNSSSDDSEAGEESVEEDEETAFDRKLADALGTAGMENDSDDDGSDMDDDQMMALDSHLTTIFKERKTGSSKKQENKDAKQNMVHFKSRVLDLLKKYVESQYANPIALDLILPLTALVRTTSNKAVAEKAFNSVLKPYFDACAKHRCFPVLENEQTGLAVLQEVHDEMQLGGSKLHASACSRASLFFTKVLTVSDPAMFDQIDDMYTELHKKWYREPKSKVHSSIFTDWMSWTISTRKNA